MIQQGYKGKLHYRYIKFDVKMNNQAREFMSCMHERAINHKDAGEGNQSQENLLEFLIRISERKKNHLTAHGFLFFFFLR